MTIKLFVQLFIFANINAETKNLTQKPKVVTIFELYANGARWPVMDIFHEPQIARSLWQIQGAGISQQVLLGRSIRKTYPEIFDQPDETLYKTIYSTKPAAEPSATYHNMGLFGQFKDKFEENAELEMFVPPYANNLDKKTTQHEFLKDIFASPTQIFEGSINQTKGWSENDTLFFDDWLTKTCPTATKKNLKTAWVLMAQNDMIFKRTAEKQISAGLKPRELFGKDTFGAWELMLLWDYANSYKYAHNDLPSYKGKKMNQQLFDELTIITQVVGTSFWAEEVKVGIHSLAYGIRELIKKKAYDQNFQMRYLGISARTQSIFLFLKQLGKFTRECLIRDYNEVINQNKTGGDPQCMWHIEYASNMIWELSEIEENGTKEHLVRIIYNGEPIYYCNEIASKYNGYCTVEEYIDASKKQFEAGADFGKICNGKILFEGTKLLESLKIDDKVLSGVDLTKQNDQKKKPIPNSQGFEEVSDNDQKNGPQEQKKESPKLQVWNKFDETEGLSEEWLKLNQFRNSSVSQYNTQKIANDDAAKTFWENCMKKKNDKNECLIEMLKMKTDFDQSFWAKNWKTNLQRWNSMTKEFMQKMNLLMRSKREGKWKDPEFHLNELNKAKSQVIDKKPIKNVSQTNSQIKISDKEVEDRLEINWDHLKRRNKSVFNIVNDEGYKLYGNSDKVISFSDRYSKLYTRANDDAFDAILDHPENIAVNWFVTFYNGKDKTNKDVVLQVYPNYSVQLWSDPEITLLAKGWMKPIERTTICIFLDFEMQEKPQKWTKLCLNGKLYAYTNQLDGKQIYAYKSNAPFGIIPSYNFNTTKSGDGLFFSSVKVDKKFIDIRGVVIQPSLQKPGELVGLRHLKRGENGLYLKFENQGNGYGSNVEGSNNLKKEKLFYNYIVSKYEEKLMQSLVNFRQQYWKWHISVIGHCLLFRNRSYSYHLYDKKNIVNVATKEVQEKQYTEMKATCDKITDKNLLFSNGNCLDRLTNLVKEKLPLFNQVLTGSDESSIKSLYDASYEGFEIIKNDCTREIDFSCKEYITDGLQEFGILEVDTLREDQNMSKEKITAVYKFNKLKKMIGNLLDEKFWLNAPDRCGINI